MCYSVLTCEDPPVLPELEVLLPEGPYHPGSKTTYKCLPGYKLKVEDLPTLTCEVNNTAKMAEWSNHSLITCIPGLYYIVKEMTTGRDFFVTAV